MVTIREQGQLSISADYVRSIFSYDPITGVVSARVKRGKILPGRRVGTNRPDGRRQIKIDYELYLEHHIIWLMVHGEWPKFEIDHKNLMRSDNRLDNLRACDSSQNNANRRKRPDNKAGVKGVFFDTKRGRWCAGITKNYKHKFLGYFATRDQAAEAYQQSAIKLHGEFARFE